MLLAIIATWFYVFGLVAVLGWVEPEPHVFKCPTLTVRLAIVLVFWPVVVPAMLLVGMLDQL